MKKLFAALAALAICGSAITLGACTDKREKYIGIEGTVIEKDFKPAYSYTTMIWTGKFAVPMIHNVPDSWYLTVEYEIGEESEECRYKVSETEYYMYSIGDTYVYEG